MSGSRATLRGVVAKPCVKDINLHRGGHDRTSEAADLEQSLHIPGICAFFSPLEAKDVNVRLGCLQKHWEQ